MDIVRFLKNWTLPIGMCLGAVIYLLVRFVPLLQPIGRWYAPYNDHVLPDFMFLILFITFCKVDFRKLLPVRWHLAIGLQQVVLASLLTLLLVHCDFSRQTVVILQAILVCVIGPCAAAAAVITTKLGGSLEEMTTYTFISNFISALLIPLCFPLLPNAGEAAGRIAFLPLFLHIFRRVSIVLLLPMLLAFVVKHCFKRLHRFIVNVKDLSYYLWGCSLSIVTGTTMMNIVDAWEHTSWAFLAAIALISLVLCIIQFVTGRRLGRLFRRTIEGGQSLGQKNTAFAIWVATAFLNPLSSVGPGCYVIWQNVINSYQLWRNRRKTA